MINEHSVTVVQERESGHCPSPVFLHWALYAYTRYSSIIEANKDAETNKNRARNIIFIL